MNLESVRLMFSESESSHSFVSAQKVKRSTKHLCRKLNNNLRSIQEDCEEYRWLIDNTPLLVSSLHAIGFQDFSACEETFSLIEQYIGTPNADFSKEEILAFFECFANTFSSDEEELFSLRAVFLIQLGRMILAATQQNKRQIPQLFTVFHKIKDIDFDYFAELISPIERLFRQDPSGVYSKMTKTSQSLYKSKLRKEARRKKENGEDLLSKKLEIAKKNKVHIGFFLDFHKRRFPYYPLLFLVTLFLWMDFFVSIQSRLLSFLIFIPLYFFTKELVDFSLGTFMRESPLPGMKLEQIGTSEKTCVVIPSLITSKEEIDKLFFNLRQYQINNYAENESITFGLLCDLAESKTVKNTKDDELKEYLEEKTREYNELVPVFFSCLRGRRFHSSEEKYVGWERKRGAIEQFIAFLSGERWDDATIFGEKKKLFGTKYIITLDADTRLMMGQARRLVGIASHPLNQPVIEKFNGKSRVIKGHGILQPKITSSLLEPIRSSFGKLFGNGSGNVLYASASFDLMQSVFGEGNFCGKGIISVDAYYKVINGVLPEQTILSHDMPEGALLHCGLISNEYFADTNPQDAISFYKRQHRWIRGDVQNFCILKNLNGMRKFFAIENVLRYTVPFFELVTVLCSCFYNSWQGIVCSLLVIFFHFENLFISSVKALFGGNVELLYRRFSEKMRNVLVNTFYLSLFTLSAVAFEAYYYLDAILRSFYRLLISKKKLLEWQVYSPVSKSKNELLFFLPSFVIVSFSMLISNNAALNLVLVLWFLFPFICKGLSAPEKKRRGWKKSELEQMKNYAEAEFRFFEEAVTQQSNFLPPDNIQYEPIEKIAMRTSPTNIGMYLASVVAAFDLGFIDQKKMIQKLKKAKKSLDQMERWKGHLYNWYDLNTLRVIGGAFVSTVDSGNYFASVICVIQALKELNSFDPEVQELIDSFELEINQVDFTPLFHFDKSLFRVGYNAQEGKGTENHYDLYVSEARITSFIAIALGQISPYHWQKLSKLLLSFKGRAGLGSWSGTTFEYFMPPLFLPVIENSMEDETLSYAFFCQERSFANVSPGRRVYGISESAYHITDSQENYQYKAFGVPALSIQSKEEIGKVISPYSSFLMLERKNRSVLRNFDSFESLGMKGPFGFYESCVFHSNFLDDYEVIRSYMAHHKGMSILALANQIQDNRFPKRLLSYRDFASKVELLAERFPLEGKIYKKKPQKYRYQTKNNEKNELIFPFSDPITHSQLITDGKMTLQISNNGNNRILCRDLDLFDRESGGLQFMVNIGEEEYHFDTSSKGIKKICFGKHFVEYSLVAGKTLVILRLQQVPGRSALLIRGEINGCAESCSINIFFSPILQNEREFRAHPAFYKLSLEASTSSKKCLIRRRGVYHHRCLHFDLTDEFEFLVGGSSCEKNMRNRILIDSNCAIRIPFSDGISRNFAISVSIDDKEDSSSILGLLDGSYRLTNEWVQKSERKMEHLENICYYDDSCRELENQILCQTENHIRLISSEDFSSMPKEYLWKYGVSGDFPIISYYVSHGNKEDFKNIATLLRVSKKLLLSGIMIDTVILHKGSKEYFDETRERLSELISFYRCEFLLGKHPGIHFIACENERECERILCAGQFDIYGNGRKDCLKSVNWTPIQRKFSSPNKAQVGSFIDRGFMIKKEEFDPPVPFSHIVSNRMVGFVCDQNSLGFTWFRNSGLNRITKWENSPSRSTGEKIYLQYNSSYYDLLQIANHAEYGNHFAAYQGEIEGENFKIFTTVSEELSGKIILVHLSEALCLSGQIVYSFIPVVSNFPNQNMLVKPKENSVIFQPCFSGQYESFGFFTVRNQAINVHQRGERLEILFSANKESVCLLGGFSSEEHFNSVLKTFKTVPLEDILNQEKKFYEPYFLDIKDTREFWIRYQLIHGRIYGRTGLYQSSGAYGFRDQLQDSLAFLKFDPQVTKKQIIRCAAHQFEEGDVQHWWHTIRGKGEEDPGIRSCCSDDYLWLLFATSEYIEKSGDESILNLWIPFLKAEPLAEECERYFRPQKGEKSPLSEHLKRSVRLALDRGLGKNNLPFIGSGDWNDGMNLVGGESAWLGFFMAICLNRTKKFLDTETVEQVNQFLRKLHRGLKSAYNGLWFLRVIREDESVLGSDCSLESECSIDLITQAFSAFYYLEFEGEDVILEPNDIKSALKNSFEILFDEKSRTTALFQKPFVNTEPTPGYIQRYCAGVRENGGQYTHAAVWFALALLRFGRKFADQVMVNQAKQVAESLSPFENVAYEGFIRYQREPYVLCGDVYTAKGLKGHGGWSWYTGAAGWYLKLMDELDQEKTSG